MQRRGSQILFSGAQAHYQRQWTQNETWKVLYEHQQTPCYWGTDWTLEQFAQRGCRFFFLRDTPMVLDSLLRVALWEGPPEALPTSTLLWSFKGACHSWLGHMSSADALHPGLWAGWGLETDTAILHFSYVVQAEIAIPDSHYFRLAKIIQKCHIISHFCLWDIWLCRSYGFDK